MSVIVRLASGEDAVQWAEMLHGSLGNDYPDKSVYDPAWCAAQVVGGGNQAVWVAETDGKVVAAISVLRPTPVNVNPVFYIGRQLTRSNGESAAALEELVRKMVSLADGASQALVVRVAANDHPSQVLYEKFGFLCVGFQPSKHSLPKRIGVLFYVRQAEPVLARRRRLVEASTHVGELAQNVLGQFRIRDKINVLEGGAGYPLGSDAEVKETAEAEYDLARKSAAAANASPEVSTGYNIGVGLLRIAPRVAPRAFVATRGGKPTAGVTYLFDELDRSVRLVSAFTADDVSLGSVLLQVLKFSQEKFNPLYTEIDVLAEATRLLRTAEQLGFVPVAYLPAFGLSGEAMVDVVKLVKLNTVYSVEDTPFTQHARSTVETVDRMFSDQKIGVAIINLLRALPIFSGLGDGELRKIARLFTQKLYRPGEKIFNKGDNGEEAYVVMRGQVDILLEENASPIANVPNGKIFGELAFLDGSPRNAMAVANQPSILLVMQRSALNELILREPHLGMVIMRNIAMDLSNKLRQANTNLKR